MNEWGRVITAMVTPFDASDAVDESGVAALVDHLLSNGSDGIVVSGTTGESPTLSVPEKLHLFRLVKDAIMGRGALIAGTGGNDTAETIRLSREAESIGVDGLLLVTPYYNKPSQEGLYRHFKAVAEAVEAPVMLYNVPPRTSVNLEAETVLRLARDVRNIVAVKEASSNLTQATDIISDAPEGFRLYSGEDAVTLPLLSVGGYGVVSVTSHIVGRDLQAMHRAFFSGETAESARLHSRMMPIIKACFQSTTPSPAPVKAAMNLLGISVGGLRPPLVEVNERERGIVQAALTEYGLL
jgi:4-hydroxy-tetrahydrodipicolinate synthase